MRLSGTVFLAICVLAIAALPSQAAIVTVTQNSLVVLAREGDSAYGSDQDVSPALDRSNTITATDGSSSSTATLNWSTSGSTYAKLSFDFAHTRGATQFSDAETYDSNLYFTVNSNTTYSLSGVYELTSGSQTFSAYTYLYDYNAGQYLFRDENISSHTANEKFILGDAGDGDNWNYTDGNLNGMLLAGHTYQLFFLNHIYATESNGAGASAVGSLTLEIGTAPTTAPVPEPATLTMWGLGAFSCAVAAYRRKQKQAAA